MKDRNTIVTVLSILDQTYPTIAMHEVHGHDPFHLLIAVILSQRSRDSVTVPTATKLFAVAPTPLALAALPPHEVETIIHPLGFSSQRAKNIQAVARLLVEKYHSQVPSTEQELLSLPSVGRKTANILLTTFFGKAQIAVDVHVQRITNRLGWIRTTDPRTTEEKLTALIPKQFHGIVNRVFVAHGQTICLPRIPRCTTCPIKLYCDRVGVVSYQ